MLFENFLNAISYIYYPKDKSVFDIDYNSSIENKRYIEKVYFNNSNNTEIKIFLEELNKKIRPLSAIDFKMGSNFPSYNFQIQLNSKKKEINVISVYISHFIPFYHICKLNGNEKLYIDKISINENYSEEELILVNLIKNELTNTLLHYEFPQDILNKRIPKINIEENFTYLNAFFIDCYRIINF